MTSDFATLKERVNLADYIAGCTGGKLSSVGSDTLNLSECPFCKGDKCFRIFPLKNSFKCFKCSDQVGGDVYDFVQLFNNCDQAEALQTLATDQGYELTRQAPDKVNRSPEQKKALSDRIAIFEAAADYYQAGLFNNKEAIGYQRKFRRHTDATLKTFRVGYSDGRLYEHLKNKDYSDDQLIESGLVKDKKGRLHDLFLHDLYIYPHLDRKNRVAGFTIKDKRKKYNYRLPGEHWGPNCIFYNMPAFGGKDVILVEGENDLLSVYGRGGFQNVAAINGQISKAQLDYLVNWAPGKTLYLCFDNDKAGQGYIDRVCLAIKKFCLPDSMADLLRDKATELRIIRFDEDVNDIDEYLKGQKTPAATLEALVKGSERYFPPLRELKSTYSKKLNDRKFNHDTYGKICFEWFQARGKFFIDGEECHLYYDKRIYKIGNNTAFNALLYDQAGINAAANGARLTIQNIESQAYLTGEHTSAPGWIFTNFKENTVYFNLCDDFNNLLKIGPGKIEKAPNGTNAERVLLKNSPKMLPICFLKDADIKKGMASLNTHIFENLACKSTDRYFVACLIFFTVLLQYVKARGVNKFSGTKGCGKTSAASIFSVFIYGEDCVTTSSAASDFSDAAVSPLVILDNLESDAVRGPKRDFIITSSTGIIKQKRKAGSDSENVRERSCTQVLVTSIEPFPEPELIERTNEILFGKKFHNPYFKEAVALETDLKEARDLIWSTIFKIIAMDILPNIEQKKADALKIIRKDFPNHSKSRLNELYAMLYLILEEVVKYISQPGFENDPSEASWIFKEWIVAQNERAISTEAETNRILQALESLVTEYEMKPEAFERGYRVKAHAFRNDQGELQSVTFTVSTGELYKALDWLAKDRGIANKFRNSAQLGARINDSLEILNKSGWEFKRNAKKIRGKRLHQFIKKFEQ